MWYCLPTAPWIVKGREKGSYTNQRYALRDLPPNTQSGLNAAKAYLEYPKENGVDLRQNYLELVRAITKQLEEGNTVKQLLGFLDAPKYTSSLLLFEEASQNGFDQEVFDVVQRALVHAEKKNKKHKKHKNNKKNNQDEKNSKRKRFKWQSNEDSGSGDDENSGKEASGGMMEQWLSSSTAANTNAGESKEDQEYSEKEAKNDDGSDNWGEDQVGNGEQ